MELRRIRIRTNMSRIRNTAPPPSWLPEVQDQGLLANKLLPAVGMRTDGLNTFPYVIRCRSLYPRQFSRRRQFFQRRRNAAFFLLLLLQTLLFFHASLQRCRRTIRSLGGGNGGRLVDSRRHRSRRRPLRSRGRPLFLATGGRRFLPLPSSFFLLSGAECRVQWRHRPAGVENLIGGEATFLLL